ncbi:MAG: Txe/YoeB family addiction module toxin [Dysgonamonadaceae bacterium]|jgi:toxin YoeB|nr:Txe/YoeB family addiction module toxin [Dysgonamonadaceae bacterium]
MIYKVRFSDEADRSIAKYKKSNPIAYKKVIRLLKEITERPREGIGHPEPLIKGNSVTYSRRISANDRIIYDIYDDLVVVLILSIEGHYKDK